MKSIIQLVFLLLSFVSFSGCEDIGIVEKDISFINLYVVDGQISPGEIDPTINFTKSIPINENYNIENTALTKVNAYIWSSDQGIFNLEHVGNGQYRPTRLKILPNSTYELFAEINGTRIYSKTKVPSVPKVIGIQKIKSRMVCEVAANKNEVYSCIFIVYETNAFGTRIFKFREKEFSSVEGPKENGIIEIRTGIIPQDISSKYKIAVEIYAWDESYKEYFETMNNNKQIDDIFSQGGGLINWNVHGDNTIGLFMGYSFKVKYNY